MKTMKINQQLINEFKALYNDVFTAKIGKQDFIFRALTIEEYNKFTALDESSADLEELVVMNGVIHPVPIDCNKMRAGDVTSLSNEIFQVSGFLSLEVINSYLAEAREAAKAAIPAMQAFIIAAMPTYNKDLLDTYTLKQITNLVAIAESILDIQSGVVRGETLSISLAPEAEAPQQARPRARREDVNLEDLEMVQADPDKSSRVGTAVSNDPIARRLMEALGG